MRINVTHLNNNKKKSVCQNFYLLLDEFSILIKKTLCKFLFCIFTTPSIHYLRKKKRFKIECFNLKLV